MYTAHSIWIDYEIDEALRMKKNIIGVKPWGNQIMPRKIKSNSNIMVGWNSASVIDAVRRYA
ncbi:TIR domain-containing protein [Magnetococcus marinus]|uniref:TIR domain-containing protein n=1 Tax=Magnetococcus marinus TaxID=1124597 RepID=UPI001D11D355